MIKSGKLSLTEFNWLIHAYMEQNCSVDLFLLKFHIINLFFNKLLRISGSSRHTGKRMWTKLHLNLTVERFKRY